MDRTSIQDFQIFHNPHAVPHAEGREAHDCPIESIEQYTDEDEGHAGSAPHSSDPDEAIFDHLSRHSSPATSRHSDEDISTLASEPYYTPLPAERRIPSSPFTPLTIRSPFRNPSSVRAMQMEATPPPYLISPSSQHRYRFTSPSRNGTPQSTRSHHSSMRSPSKLSPTKKPKKEHPLVLLHVTLLPPTIPYSASVMQTVLPPSILSNIKLLREKTTPTVLSRGILIPHPQEDYDLLEERLLESLELTLPRILKCGHFHLDAGTEEDIAAAAAAAAETDDDEDDGALDADICADCGRRVRDARLGSGKGTRRWDIKIYAANGLMRAGAWSAAWREMERVDVEIGPWIGEEMRRELESRREAEEEEEVGREEDPSRGEDEEEGAQQEQGRRPDTPARSSQQHPLHTGRSKPTRMHDARLREIYGDVDDPQALVNRLAHPSPPRKPLPSSRPQPIPLPTLLKHHLLLAARDRRNIALCALTLLVLLLALRPSVSSSLSPTPLPLAAAGAGVLPEVVMLATDVGADAVAGARGAVAGVVDGGVEAMAGARALAGGAVESAVRAVGEGMGSGVEVEGMEMEEEEAPGGDGVVQG